MKIIKTLLINSWLHSVTVTLALGFSMFDTTMFDKLNGFREKNSRENETAQGIIEK